VDGAVDRERFQTEIVAKLTNVPLSKIIGATGISLGYASMIRRGLCAPHPMHYDALTALSFRE
jgi:hypothetical protein